MKLVEALRYQIPTNTPEAIKDRREDRILVDEVDGLAQQLGFRRYGGAGYTVVHGVSWQIFENPHLAVPNFPEGDTTVHAMLALTPQEDSVEPSEYPNDHALLRVSKDDFDPYEFNRDTRAFTSHFLRRPRVWGFPSRLMMEGKFFTPALIAGSVLGGLAGFWANLEGRTFDSASFGVLIGELTTMFGVPSLGRFAENRAVRQLSHPEQYFIGKAAQNTLLNIKNHMLAVLVQRELYDLLRKDHPGLSPEGFLQKVYTYLPMPLMAKRAAELLSARLPEEARPALIGNSLSPLVQVGDLLLAAA